MPWPGDTERHRDAALLGRRRKIIAEYERERRSGIRMIVAGVAITVGVILLIATQYYWGWLPI